MPRKSYRSAFDMKLFYLLLLCLLPVFVSSLEFAVGTSKGPVIMSPAGQNFTARRIRGANAAVSALAIDTVRGRVFFATVEPSQPGGVLVQSAPLDPGRRDGPEPVIRTAQGPQNVKSLAYDHLNDALYWTDTTKHEISMIKLSDKDQNATVIHRFEETKSLAGIAVDVCRGLLFWTNINHLNASVERSNLDGSGLKAIVKSDLYLPMDVAVDSSGDGRLFWVDRMQGSEYKIEMSRLDGTSRVLLVKDVYQRPYTMSYAPPRVRGGAGSVLWADVIHEKILEVEVLKDGVAPDMKPRQLHRFPHDTLVKALVVMSDDRRPAMCENASSNEVEPQATHTEEGPALLEGPSEDPVTEGPTTTDLPQETTSTAAPRNDTRDANHLRFYDYYCINGEAEGQNGACKCQPGYSGSRCERWACDNYCVHGSCSVERAGDIWEPKCLCRRGFEGRRCERDPCAGYCLNGGRCRVESDGKPRCSCPGNGRLASGDRCEQCPNLLERVCLLLCSLDTSKASVSMLQLEGRDDEAAGPLCVCPSGSNKYIYSTTKGNLNMTSGDEWPLTSSSSSALISPIFLIPVGVCIVLLVIALFLAYKVMKLRRLPRIKKRIIVSKGSVPLASGCGGIVRGRSSNAGSPVVEEQQQCEITIENCCNMNVCETPCFEPQLRSPGKSSSSKKASTKEEKKVLLGNMEGTASSCGPCQGVEELY